MTRSLLRLDRDREYDSLVWIQSQILTGVSFCIRRPSLGQRIRLTERIAELVAKQEFLAGGTEPDRLQAALADLQVKKIYLEWGLNGIRGLKINGVQADPTAVIEDGPEELIDEIVLAVKNESNLSQDEIKNS